MRMKLGKTKGASVEILENISLVIVLSAVCTASTFLLEGGWHFTSLSPKSNTASKRLLGSFDIYFMDPWLTHTWGKLKKGRRKLRKKRSHDKGGSNCLGRNLKGLYSEVTSCNTLWQGKPGRCWNAKDEPGSKELFLLSALVLLWLFCF